ncbi:MAG TPA: DUF4366 domain-containing protein [Lachnospiraceae bacterium]|nr:DUF4366 domain-containing protein [Lachnospiraceae bacterium]
MNFTKDKLEDIAGSISSLSTIASIADSLRKKDEEVLELEDKKTGRKIVWFLAIIGAIAAVALIAYAVYRYFTPDYLEDFEDDFDDDFDDDFFDDPEEKDQVKEESEAEK